MSKRANHEGTGYQRQDGRWVSSITLPGGRRKSFYGKTRQEVARKLTVGLKARLDGLPLPDDQLKVGTFLQDWLQSTQASIRASTWLRYKQLVHIHAIPALGHLPITRLAPRHVQKLYADFSPKDWLRLRCANSTLFCAALWGKLPSRAPLRGISLRWSHRREYRAKKYIPSMCNRHVRY